MYHISDDPRAHASAQRICDALMECARRKPFSEISVTDLYKEHRISRTTFYRLFDNTVDVLEYMVDQMGRNILLTLHGDSPKALTIQAISALRERRELLELLSESGHIDLLRKKQEEYLPMSMLANGLELGDSYDYFHAILAQLLPTAMDIWVRDGMMDSPEAVYEKLRKSILTLGTWFSD